MSNKTNRSLHEKIILLILYLIGSPFIIGGLLLFIVVYLIVFIFEILFYITSKYYKEVKEKYYTLITFSKSYQKYNKLRKNTKLSTNNNFPSFENAEYSITLLLEKSLTINKELLDKLSINNKTNYFVVNTKNISKDELNKLNANYKLITFKD